MTIRKILPLSFYAILIIGLIIYYFNPKLGGMVIFIFLPLLILVLYATFIKEFKNDEVWF